MRKIFTIVVFFVILCGLYGCDKKSTSENNSACSSMVSQSASTCVSQSDEVDSHDCASNSKAENVVTIDKSRTSSTISSKPVQKNSKLNSSSKVKKAENPSKAPQKRPPVSQNPKSHIEPVPLEIAKNWDSLYSQKEWTFCSTEPKRQTYENSDALVCRFSAGQDTYATIFVESYCLLSNWKYPINDGQSVRTINGQKYVQIDCARYRGSISTFVGGEDVVTLELRCYNATGHKWLSDELKFKRTGNNSLQLMSGDYNEFGLKNGDVFNR